MVYIVQYIYIQSANACTAVHEQPSYERAAATGGAALVDACFTLYFVRGIDAKPRNGETAQECKRSKECKEVCARIAEAAALPSAFGRRVAIIPRLCWRVVQVLHSD